MRTTLKIDDDVLRAARSLATAQGKTVGEVVSDLARRGLKPQAPRKVDRRFPVFEVSERAAPLTSEMVQQALDDGE